MAQVLFGPVLLTSLLAARSRSSGCRNGRSAAP